MKHTNYQNIDKAIKRFYDYLPHGENFNDGIHDFNFQYTEQTEILKFLTDNSILKLWGEHGKHILTETGESIVEDYDGIEKYLKQKQTDLIKQKNLEKIATEKLYFDAKLSKWQVKVFWYVFIFGLLGGIYTIYSIIDSVVGESEEQKIERIIENKLQDIKE